MTTDSLIEALESKVAKIVEDKQKVAKGCKAAGVRVRKLTLDITKIGKAIREISLVEEKE